MPNILVYISSLIKSNIYWMRVFFRLIRIKHWVKNSFIFIPAFFAGEIFNVDLILKLSLGFFTFSLFASVVYIFNDLRDIELDMNHPDKKSRPLASGQIKRGSALALATLLLIISIVISVFLGTEFVVVVLLYLILNLLYSFGLKTISILDIIIIAIGFVLRVLAGGFLAQVELTQWLLIMVFLLALFIAFAKRLDDILVFNAVGKKSRALVDQYNLEFIYSGITMLAGVILVSYIMYTVSESVINRLHSRHLYVTSIFVIAGILRYLQITLVERNSGSPVKILFTDRFIIVCFIGWLVTFFGIIYLQISV